VNIRLIRPIRLIRVLCSTLQIAHLNLNGEQFVMHLGHPTKKVPIASLDDVPKSG